MTCQECSSTLLGAILYESVSSLPSSSQRIATLWPIPAMLICLPQARRGWPALGTQAPWAARLTFERTRSGPSRLCAPCYGIENVVQLFYRVLELVVEPWARFCNGPRFSQGCLLELAGIRRLGLEPVSVPEK
jgi:hypothetical protein